MKKTSIAMMFAVLIAAALTNGVWATPFDDFKKQLVGKAGLAPFAADLGGLIGGTDFSSGRAVGFPGFDVGIGGMIQTKPNTGNVILKRAGVKAFGVVLPHATVALPVVGADVTLRGITYSGFSIMGGGLTYPVFKSGTLTMFIPDVAVSVFYDAINFKYFTGSHMSFDAAASFNIPVIKPFIGVGYDRTKVEVKGVSTLLNGLNASASKPRMTLGVKLIPFPFLYAYGAYTVLHGDTGMNFGLGAKF